MVSVKWLRWVWTTARSRASGARPLAGLGGYNKQVGLNHFDLLIDWGWFYFITKPMFLALDFFYHLVGNFGFAILLVTVLVKLLFFPLPSATAPRAVQLSSR